MFTPVEAYLGWRYTRAKRRNHFVSFISAIAMFGVALGVAALITILSIMNGFESELRDRILGMAAHVVVTAEDGRLHAASEVSAIALETPGVMFAAPFIRREAMLTHYTNVQGVIVRGIEPAAEAQVSVIAEKMLGGDFDELRAGEFNVVLGAGLAQSLQARVGSEVTLVAPEPVRTPAGMVPRLKQFTVVGVFEAGVHEYDTSMALVHITDAAKLFRFRNAVSGVRVKVADPYAAPHLGQDLVRRLQAGAVSGVTATDWTETNVNLFKALKTEKIVMSVILALTIGVAAFNLVSTLVMVVAEKNAEIAVLQTLGMNRRRILKTFLIHGGFIGVAGIVMGTVFGVTLALNVDVIVTTIEQTLHMKFLSPEVYYISEIPAELEAQDVVLAVGVAAVLCLCAPLYPAWLASRTAPARALRYD